MFKKLFGPKPIDFVSPMTGEIIAMEDVNDPVFSEKTIGDGFAIKIDEGDVYSPVDGVVVAVFPTNHAIGIKSDDRNEFLIHIGLDTCTHEGRGLKSFVKIDDRVSKGDKLVEVDHDYFKENNVDMTSPIIVTNLHGRLPIKLKEGRVSAGDTEILAIKV